MYLICSEVWLNYFLDDHYFGYITKSFLSKPLLSRWERKVRLVAQGYGPGLCDPIVPPYFIPNLSVAIVKVSETWVSSQILSLARIWVKLGTKCLMKIGYQLKEDLLILTRLDLIFKKGWLRKIWRGVKYSYSPFS